MVTIIEADKTAINEIFELFTLYRNLPFVYEGDKFLYRLLWKLKISGEPIKIFVAKNDGKIIGCVYGLKHLGAAGWLGGLFVDPHYRRRGIGKQLMKHCINSLRDLGCSEIFLFTDPRNIPAVNLFRKLGFSLAFLREDWSLTLQNREFAAPHCSKPRIEDLPQVTAFLKNRIIRLFYYPVRLLPSVIRDLVKKERIVVYKPNDEKIIGALVFSISKLISVNDASFIFRDEWIEKLGKESDIIMEINLITKENVVAEALLLEAIHVAKVNNCRNLICYHRKDDGNKKVLQRLGFEKVDSAVINVMKLTVK